MSWQATNWARTQTTGSTLTKTILLLLADLADEEHSCFPGQQRLAEDAEMHVNSVANHLRKLEELDLIRRQFRYDKRGKRTSDRFYLAVDGGFPAGIAPRSLATSGVGSDSDDYPHEDGPLTTSEAATTHTLGVEEPLEEPPVGGGDAPELAAAPTDVALTPTRNQDGVAAGQPAAVRGWDEHGPTARHCPDHPPTGPDVPCRRCAECRELFPDAERKRAAARERAAAAAAAAKREQEWAEREAKRASAEVARAAAAQIRQGLPAR